MIFGISELLIIVRIKMEYQKVLDYWFGKIESNKDLAIKKNNIWFQGSSEIDMYITETFKKMLEKAEKNELDFWQETTRGNLALIILLDQFSRNIYRNSKKAYQSDKKSLAICIDGIDKKIDKNLYPIEKQFFYMPLQHAENIQIQEKSVFHYKNLLQEAPEATKSYFESTVKSAEQHKEIIDLFGRFPHRNKILGRNSSKKEIEFLKTPNSSF